jgi:hypothetical protein
MVSLWFCYPNEEMAVMVKVNSGRDWICVGAERTLDMLAGKQLKGANVDKNHINDSPCIMKQQAL